MSGEATRPYVLVGELVLSDGTRYTHSAVYEAMDMEAALRRIGVKATPAPHAYEQRRAVSRQSLL